MKALLLTALLIGMVGAVSIYTLRARAEDLAATQRMAFAAMQYQRFPAGCPPVVRLATNDFCSF